MNNTTQVTGGTGTYCGDEDSPIVKGTDYEPNNIVFRIGGNTPEELIRINPEGFFWKGKLVQDDKEIYLRFKEWLDSAIALRDKKSEPKNE